MSADALTPQERAAVRYSLNWTIRSMGPGMTRDDLLQEGRIAAWRARDALADVGDDVHRLNSLRLRVRGAMYDANRTAWRQWPEAVFSIDADDPDDDSPRAVHAVVAPDQPERAMQLREVVAQIHARGTPQLVECLSRLAEGADARTVARDMDLCETRVAQMRRQARAIAAECW